MFNKGAWGVNVSFHSVLQELVLPWSSGAALVGQCKCTGWGMGDGLIMHVLNPEWSRSTAGTRRYQTVLFSASQFPLAGMPWAVLPPAPPFWALGWAFLPLWTGHTSVPCHSSSL
jgi:hypothetical protein